MQRHDYSIDVNATVVEVWDVFWNRARPRVEPPQRKYLTRKNKFHAVIHILHPGDDVGEGLIRRCWFQVPWWLGTGGVGQSWEWLTLVRPHESWRYNAVGKPLWSSAEGHTRLEVIDESTTRIHFSKTYHAFNPILRRLLEKRVHASISRDNDEMIALIERAVHYQRKQK